MSRTDSTLDDWVTADDGAERPDRRPQWQPDSARCQCGAELSNWHPTVAERNRILRIYGDENDEVPACPDCVEWAPNATDKINCVTRAIRAMPREATIKRTNPKALALEQADDGQ